MKSIVEEYFVKDSCLLAIGAIITENEVIKIMSLLQDTEIVGFEACG